jgi:hypothetical protein
MTMFHRRSLGGMLLGAGLLGWRGSSANPVPPAQKLRFIISRNNSDIGSHEVSFDPAGEDLAVHINVQMRVGFGPLTFFHYHHRGEERWRGGQFISLQTQTDDDGDQLHVHAQRTGDHIRVQATGLAPQDLPGTALPLTHWNVACMHAQLFNPQDGTVMQEKSEPRGSEVVVLANGTRVQATRYALNGKAPINDWYDEKQVWTKLTAKVKDGSSLIYTRQV